MIEYDEYDEYDEFLDDEDDINLIELVTTDSKSSNQYLVFDGSSGEVFGIHVAKVRELVSMRELSLIQRNKDGSIVRATADIRDEMTTIINFDEWFGNEVLGDDKYELIILTGFGGKNIGIMITNVEYIVNIDPANMYESHSNRSKTNFVAKIKLNNQDRLCTIFDCDKMLVDIFDLQVEVKADKISAAAELNRDKTLLFADDSRLIQKLATGLFKKLQIKARIFKDGQELLEALQGMQPEEVGLIVTDLEMPLLDGYGLIEQVKALPEYSDIEIIVHSNLSNDVVSESLRGLGVVDVIGKIDMNRLGESVRLHFH